MGMMLYDSGLVMLGSYVITVLLVRVETREVEEYLLLAHAEPSCCWDSGDGAVFLVWMEDGREFD